MLQDQNDGLKMLWDRDPKTGATPRDFEGCKPPIEFLRTQVPPRGIASPSLGRYFEVLGRHNRTREPGHAIVPEIWGKLLTILSARGAEDKRKATGGIFRHRVL